MLSLQFSLNMYKIPSVREMTIKVLLQTADPDRFVYLSPNFHVSIMRARTYARSLTIQVIERFYSKRLHQSWKNVLSIGDSPHERDALIRATCGSLPVDVYDRRKRSRSVLFFPG